MILNHNGKDIHIKDWNREKLGSLIVVDTETTFLPFYMTPDLCTMQVYEVGSNNAYLVPKELRLSFFNKHYASTFIFLNAAFDLDVLSKDMEAPKFAYELLDECRVRDIGILYRLWHLGVVGFVPKKWGMAAQMKHLFNIEIDKETNVRTTFEAYKNKRLSDIPEEYVTYAFKDVFYTADIYNFLMPRIEQIDKYGTLLSHDIQAKGDLALTHIHKNGIKFDLSKRDSWLACIQADMERCENIMASWGFVRGVRGNQDALERILTTLGISDKLPLTETGKISTKSEDLQSFRDIPFVKAYLDYMEMEKATTFVRNIDTEKVHPKYNLLVNTGRTSCSSPNFQQLPKVGGIREMFIAEEGKTFAIVDYSAIELSTLAQVLYDAYGESVMRDKINEGVDLHRYYASVMHSCELDAVTKQWRQEAKAANFGFPGGLGVDTFIEFSRGYGLELSRQQAQEMKDVWFEAFPEIRNYMQNEQGSIYTRTGRRRNDTTYCAEKNTPFQGLAADGAKLALYNLDKNGFKIVGFVHDEIVCEIDNDSSSERVLELMGEIMIKSMQQVVPDVRISVEGMLSTFYTK